MIENKLFNGNIYFFNSHIYQILLIAFPGYEFYLRTLVLDIEFHSQTWAPEMDSRETVHFNQQQVDKTVVEAISLLRVISSTLMAFNSELHRKKSLIA